MSTTGIESINPTPPGFLAAGLAASDSESTSTELPKTKRVDRSELTDRVEISDQGKALASEASEAELQLAPDELREMTSAA